MNIPRLPDAELFIMKIIWRYEAEITSAIIMKELEGKKSWVQPTLLNFLARLVERGFLSVRKEGKVNIYLPIISEERYLEKASKSFLEQLHGNSLKSFMVSLYGGKAIWQGEIEELRRFIEEKAEESGKDDK